jgi:hypothetical protein
MAEHEKPKIITWGNLVMDGNYVIQEVAVRGITIKKGISSQELIARLAGLGHSYGMEYMPPECPLLIWYYIDGDYYSFYFDGDAFAKKNKLVEIDVGAGY